MLNATFAGVRLAELTLVVNSPSPLQIIERTNLSLNADLIALASEVGGNAIGDNLWDVEFFFSSDEEGGTMSISAEAQEGSWQDTGESSFHTLRRKKRFDLAPFCHSSGTITTDLPYFGKRKQVTYHLNLSY